MPPFINSVKPNQGDPGDRFTVVIHGDVFTHVTKCDFGNEIEVDRFQVDDDGTIRAKLIIADHAIAGKRKLVLTDPSGNGELQNAFEVL
jgi:hypothetical protein